MISNRGLWLFAAASIAFAMGCGTTPTTDAGNGCTTDATCGTGKVCHPVLKECVQSCTGSSDCPSAEKTCAKYDGTAATTASPGFCQCSTDALCNNSVAGNICSGATRQCSAKCVGVGGCPINYSCNSTSGQCVGAGTDGGTDGGTDAGVMDAGTPCSGLGTCVYPEVCDFTASASACKPSAACNMSGVQPDVCGYAGYCTGNSDCAQVLPATCSNFASTGATPAVFNPKTSTGPIIFYVENDASPPAASCFKGFFSHSFYINAYQDTNWPGVLTGVSGAWYVTTAGVKQDITAGLPGSYYVATGKTLRLRKYLCAKQSASLNAGFFFTGGNETCAASSGAVAGTTSCTSSAQCGGTSVCDTVTGICS
jgi:hypothetical protein